MIGANSFRGKMPAWFLTHGGGPLPLLGETQHASMVSHWKTLAKTLPARPSAILLISAHWEETLPTVNTSPNPSMLYDYSNFPPESYKLQYPAPGNPGLAKKLAQMLKSAGLPAKEDSARGFDHGAFVPLKVIFPAADIPVVMLSILSSMDAKEHLELGEALSDIREQGVLVIGSGSSYHNIRQMLRRGGEANKDSQDFDAWLQQALAVGDYTAEQRKELMQNWKRAPGGRASHPREEHLLPAHVVLGAAKGEKARVMYEGTLLGAKISSYVWT